MKNHFTTGERARLKGGDSSLIPFRQAQLNLRRLHQVRQWIFVYFFLLIFEGVFRKWIFGSIPLISMPLVIIRDPVAMIIYYFAWRANVIAKNIRFAAWLGLGAFSMLGALQILSNPELNVLIVLYGIRTYWLHIPLIFVIAEVLSLQDLQRIGRWFLLLSGPMAALMVAQFLAPPNSLLNRGMVEGVGQLGTVLGKIRPAGTFSFNTGAASFNLLVMTFLFYSFIDSRWTPSWSRWVAAVSLVAVLPVSGSRAFVLNSGILLAFALLGGNFNRRLLWLTLRTIVIGGGIFGILMLTGFFQESVQTFLIRWSEANDASGGSFKDAIVFRFFGEFIRAFNYLGETPLFGHGIGLGSNFGAALTSGALVYELAESEWERTVLEMGPLVAVIWLCLRCGFGVFIIRNAWSCLSRGYPLAWLLLGGDCLAIFNGFLQQPTSLGFIVFTNGLCLAAIKSVDHSYSSFPESKVVQRINRRIQGCIGGRPPLGVGSGD